MKKILALALTLALAAAASAAPLKTPAFTVDVPEGWTAATDSEGSVILKSSDGATAVTMTAQELKTEQERRDLDPRDVALYLSGNLREGDAKTGEVKTVNGVSTFTVQGTIKDDLTKTNTLSEFRLSLENNKWFMMIVIENGSGNPAVDALLASLRYN